MNRKLLIAALTRGCAIPRLELPLRAEHQNNGRSPCGLPFHVRQSLTPDEWRRGLLGNVFPQARRPSSQGSQRYPQQSSCPSPDRGIGGSSGIVMRLVHDPSVFEQMRPLLRRTRSEMSRGLVLSEPGVSFLGCSTPGHRALQGSSYPDRGSPALFQNYFRNGFALDSRWMWGALRFSTFPSSQALSHEFPDHQSIGAFACRPQDCHRFTSLSHRDQLTNVLTNQWTDQLTNWPSSFPASGC